jgi:hypothetical protein
MVDIISVSRRAFIGGGTAAVALAGLQPAWARTVSTGVASKGFGTLSGNNIDLTIARSDSC